MESDESDENQEENQNNIDNNNIKNNISNKDIMNDINNIKNNDINNDKNNNINNDKNEIININNNKIEDTNENQNNEEEQEILEPPRPELEEIEKQTIRLLSPSDDGPHHPRTLFFINDPEINSNKHNKDLNITEYEIKEKK